MRRINAHIGKGSVADAQLQAPHHIGQRAKPCVEYWKNAGGDAAVQERHALAQGLRVVPDPLIASDNSVVLRAKVSLLEGRIDFELGMIPRGALQGEGVL